MNSPPALVLAGLALAATLSPSSSDQAPTIDVRERVLANGLRVLVAPRKGAPVASCRLVLAPGSVDDPPGLPGLTLLVTRLLDQGTQQIGVRDLEREVPLRRQVEDLEDALRLARNEAIEPFRRGEGPDPDDPGQRPSALTDLRKGLAAMVGRQRRELFPGEARSLYARAGATAIDSWVEPDAAVFAVTLPASRVEVFFWLEADRLANAVMRDVAGTRDLLRAEALGRLDDDPSAEARAAFASVLWAAHPYGAPPGGLVPLDGVTRAELARAKDRLIAPGGAVVVVAGDVDPDAVFALAERYFGGLPAGAARDESPPRAAVIDGVRRLEVAARAPTSVAIAWVTPSAASKDLPALEVAAQLLGGPGGRLERRLVVAERLTLRARARLDAGRLGGAFTIEAEPSGDAIAPVEEALRGVIDTLRRGPIAADELERARALAIGAFLDTVGDTLALANALAMAEARGARRALTAHVPALQEVTADDVQRVARETLADGTRAVFIRRRSGGAPPPAPAPASRGVLAASSQPAATPASAPAAASAPASAPAAASPASHPAPSPASHPAPPPASHPAPPPASHPAPPPASHPAPPPASHPTPPPASHPTPPPASHPTPPPASHPAPPPASHPAPAPAPPPASAPTSAPASLPASAPASLPATAPASAPVKGA